MGKNPMADGGKRAEKLRKLGVPVNFDEIQDHNFEGEDDVPEIQASKLKDMDRYEQFEKYYPFYRMDVNGFIFHLNEAIANCAEKEGFRSVTQIDFIRLKDLQYGFKLYKTWGAFQDAQSELVLFLHKYCRYEGNMVSEERKEEEVIFDELKVKILGILWCKGSPEEKAKELYDIS